MAVRWASVRPGPDITADPDVFGGQLSAQEPLDGCTFLNHYLNKERRRTRCFTVASAEGFRDRLLLLRSEKVKRN